MLSVESQTDVSEEHVIFVFRVKEKDKQETSMKQVQAERRNVDYIQRATQHFTPEDKTLHNHQIPHR
jgi:hypothetical protein